MAFRTIAAGIAAFFLTVTAAQAQVIYNDRIPTGTASFDSVVAGVGGTVTTDSLQNLSSDSAQFGGRRLLEARPVDRRCGWTDVDCSAVRAPESERRLR